MNTIYCLIACVLIILLLYWYQSPDLYEYDSSVPGPTILIVAGTHGNEPAGSVAAYQLIDLLETHPITRGKVIIIPNANKWGLALNLRFLPAEYFSLSLLGKPDLNRSYRHAGEEETTQIASKIQDWVDKSDWIIDLHEGYDFYKRNPQSMGSGLYYGDSISSKEMAHGIVNRLNQTISDSEKQFVSIDWPDLNGTLRMYCNSRNKHYLLVETSGQNDIQPLPVRTRQHLFILEDLLNELRMR